MKPLCRWILSVGLAALLASPAVAQRQPVEVIDGPIYVMIYIEVLPSTTAQALAAFKAYRGASLREPGANYVDIYREVGQSHRFVIGEIWQNRGAGAEHMKSPALAVLEETLKPMELGPSDVRIHQAYAATPPKAPGGNGVIVISHIDVAGGNVGRLLGFLDSLGEGSRREAGMVRFEILDEVPAHANHFRIYEEWANEAAWEAHNRSPHTQTYRAAALPMLGTPYDQRLYTLVD